MELLDDLKKEIPLKIRLETTITAYCIHKMGGHMFMDADEESELYKEQIEKNAEIARFSDLLIHMIFEDIDKWEEDGCPTVVKLLK